MAMLVHLLACPVTLCPAARLIESRGVAPAPRGLGALEAVLRLQPGMRALEPDARQGLHPLMVPLAASERDGEVSGVLLLPGAVRADPSRFVPVATVGSAGGAPGTALRPLGETCAAAAKRIVVEMDVADAPATDAAVAAAAAEGVAYARGEASAPLGGRAGAAPPSLAAFCILNVGPFADLYESLAAQHFARGDTASALVTCERAQRAFDDWGLPFAVHASLHAQLGRDAEARDVARVALSKPLWSLGAFGAPECLARLAELAQYEPPRPSREWYGAVRHIDGGGGSIRARASEMGLPAQSLKESDFVQALPLVAPAQFSWDAVRQELAATFEGEGRPEIARWIES
ncbi:hypothetical protein KFE25_011637 [Diacronema lutheri]|uniref:Uncharacterized protein n=2 Tax=Diacronema lutheri TaxID=2081491 RepID=A0A8J6C504_DIALT|nr:hypothetical protein KFE25_011637 [Diacronema lutheri]